MASNSQPRGIRNNNPGNIRHSADKWQGAAPEAKQTDGAFVVFTAPELGIRALVRLLLTYERRGYKSIRSILSRYAPPMENNTVRYVEHVAEQMAVDPDQELVIDDCATMLALITASSPTATRFSWRACAWAACTT
jgi:hypothetical protein